MSGTSEKHGGEDKTKSLKHQLAGHHHYHGMTLSNMEPVSRIREVQQVRYLPDDVIVASYPKTGTTITQEMVYLVRHDGDVEKANKEYIYLRVPFLEVVAPEEENPETVEVLLEKTERPRILKTHLTFDAMKDVVLEQKVQFLYVMRNPKDALVSMFHFYRMCEDLGHFTGTWSDFFERAMVDLDGVLYGNIFHHYVGWWRYRHLPNILFLKYEDLVREPKREIAKIAKFCGKANLNDEILDRITDATRFDVMKANPMTNYTDIPEIRSDICPFMRKGKVGDWKNHFTVDQNERFDAVIKAEWDGTGLEFDYE